MHSAQHLHPKLSDDIWLLILRFLTVAETPQHLVRFSQCSRISQSNRLWFEVYRAKYPKLTRSFIYLGKNGGDVVDWRAKLKAAVLSEKKWKARGIAAALMHNDDGEKVECDVGLTDHPKCEEKNHYSERGRCGEGSSSNAAEEAPWRYRLSSASLLPTLKELHQAVSISMATTGFVTDLSFEQSDRRSTVVAHTAVCFVSNSVFFPDVYPTANEVYDNMGHLFRTYNEMTSDGDEAVERLIMIATLTLIDFQTGEVLQHRCFHIKGGPIVALPVVAYLDISRDVLIMIHEDFPSRSWKSAQVYSAAHIEPPYLSITFPHTLCIHRIIPHPLQAPELFHRPMQNGAEAQGRKGSFVLLGISRRLSREGFRVIIDADAGDVDKDSFQLPLVWYGKRVSCISECVPYANHLILTGHEADVEAGLPPEITIWDIDTGASLATIDSLSQSSMFWGFAFMDEPDDFCALRPLKPSADLATSKPVKTLENAVVIGTWNRPRALTVVSVADSNSQCEIVAWDLEGLGSAQLESRASMGSSKISPLTSLMFSNHFETGDITCSFYVISPLLFTLTHSRTFSVYNLETGEHLLELTVGLSNIPQRNLHANFNIHRGPRGEVLLFFQDGIVEMFPDCLAWNDICGS
ncbi:hypothetical protein HDU67_002208 [Dinochytrium kinnereticum]|nr:hypothetical protein HDU67_002208 [Dinochytrium kinnereticum]